MAIIYVYTDLGMKIFKQIVLYISLLNDYYVIYFSSLAPF